MMGLMTEFLMLGDRSANIKQQLLSFPLNLNPFTVIPDLTCHALTIVQREPRVNSG